MFRKLLSLVLTLCTLCTLTSCSSTPTDFDTYLDTLFTEMISSDALTLHYTLTDTSDLQTTSTPVSFGHISAEYIPDSIALLENITASLDAFSAKGLSETQQLNADILSSYFSMRRELYDYYLYEEPLSPLGGVQVELPVLLAEFRISNTDDADLYLSLLASFPSYIDEVISFEIEKSNAGLFMPDFALTEVLTQCDTFLSADNTHFLYGSFENKIKALSIAASAKTQYIEKNTQVLQEKFFPSYHTLKTALQALSGSDCNENGLCYLPSGKQYYELLTKFTTGSPKSITELQDAISAKRNADLSSAAALVNAQPELLAKSISVTLDFTTPEEMLAHLQNAMLQDFVLEKSYAYSVKYADDSLSDYLAPAFYLTAPMDDLDQNVIYINPSATTTDIDLFTTLAHEGYPGHLYETVTTRQSELPNVRYLLNLSGYTEGWATYVEMLSYSYAGIDPDLAMLLMYNRAVLLSLYASLDIGIHYDGWTLPEVTSFLDTYGIRDVAVVKDVYESIVLNPCGYTKYYVGYLEFLELKENAREQFPDTFSNKAFHQALLTIGPATFEIIEKYLPKYL